MIIPAVNAPILFAVLQAAAIRFRFQERSRRGGSLLKILRGYSLKLAARFRQINVTPGWIRVPVCLLDPAKDEIIRTGLARVGGRAKSNRRPGVIGKQA